MEWSVLIYVLLNRLRIRIMIKRKEYYFYQVQYSETFAHYKTDVCFRVALSNQNRKQCISRDEPRTIIRVKMSKVCFEFE